jgi:glycosyltransferase involved in cell wall biosynthesis
MRLPRAGACSLEVDGASTQCGSTPADQPGERSRPTIWFEVEDVLRGFDGLWVMTGIQRVSHELFPEMVRLFGSSGRVRFCRLSSFSGRFEAIDLAALMTAINRPLGRFGPRRAWSEVASARGFASKLARLLRTMPGVVRWLGLMAGLIARDFLGSGARHRRFERQVRAGDVIACLGGPWIVPGYVPRVAAVKRATGARFALLIHDIIALSDPAYLTGGMIGRFGRWLEAALREVDVLFCVSDFTRQALVGHAQAVGWMLPPVDLLRIGAGFVEVEGSAPAPHRALPERYVLFVSTIEIRKNHQLLLRVWRRLIERRGAEALPALVLVGRAGWKTQEFFAELAAQNYLDGKIIHYDDVSDRELREIYRHCLFTLFPSLFEGWGSPVAESLKYGKFCAASNRASLPEVGGEFCDYFDPADEEDALAKIERILFDPGYLAAREAHLRTTCRMTSWSDCARLLMETIDRRFRPASPSADRALVATRRST